MAHVIQGRLSGKSEETSHAMTSCTPRLLAGFSMQNSILFNAELLCAKTKCKNIADTVYDRSIDR